MSNNRRQVGYKCRDETGFTIIELMISTVVFSMVLLLLTTAVINFTKSYYKGITEANTQRIARSVTESLTQTIQFNSGVYTSIADDSGWKGFCFGNEAYVYKLGWQLTDGPVDTTIHQTSHALLKLNVTGGCAGGTSALVLALSSSYTPEELLAPSMRLADLELTPLANGAYQLVINIAHGDDDLLSNPTSITPSCFNQSGSQFCAVSGISTVVQKRI